MGSYFCFAMDPFENLRNSSQKSVLTCKMINKLNKLEIVRFSTVNKHCWSLEAKYYLVVYIMA
jgi:DNA-binding Xre family transcriptional regulator